MASVTLTTYQDLIDHLVDFVEGDVSNEVERDARRSVQSAYRDLANRHPWTLYYSVARITTAEPYETGTVTYDHTGGTYERQLTLASGTWPAWAAFGHVIIENVRYEVSERKSSSIITLSVHANPGADITDASVYSLRRDTYPMPVDFIQADEFFSSNQTFTMTYSHPRWWLERRRFSAGPAFPTTYTFLGDPNYLGSMAVAFYPPPDQEYHYEVLYRRRPRALKIDNYSTGTASITSGSSTLTGSGTAWASKHVGCVLRLADNSTREPTGLTGSAPYAYERVVASVESATSLTLDAVVGETLAGVKYTLSDPADIEDGSMLNALLACSEYWMSRARNMKDRAEIEQRWLRELVRAQESDNRSMARRAAGQTMGAAYRLRDFPSGEDLGTE